MRINTLVSLALLSSAALNVGCGDGSGGENSAAIVSPGDGSSDTAGSSNDGESSELPSGVDGESVTADGAASGDTTVGPGGDGITGGDASFEQPAGLCTGEADQEAIAEYPHEALYKWMLTQVQGCFYGLGGSVENPEIPEDEFEVCITELAVEGLGVSGECASCFSDIGVCSKNFCTNPCGSVEISEGMNLQACLDCQKENYCSHAFDTCIGWSLTEDLTLPFN